MNKVIRSIVALCLVLVAGCRTIPVPIAITTQPSEAKIYVDGTYLGISAGGLAGFGLTFGPGVLGIALASLGGDRNVRTQNAAPTAPWDACWVCLPPSPRAWQTAPRTGSRSGTELSLAGAPAWR